MEFGRSFTSLGDYAFANCTSLEFIELPAGITSIGNYAFQGCSSLGEIMLSSSCLLDFIGADVFYGCNVLAKITLDDTAGSANYSVVTSGENGEYSMLTDKQFNAVLVPPAYPAEEGQTITIGEGMSYIGTQAFANNLSLAGKTIIIADTVKEIGDYAFAGTGIVKVIIPASVETLGNDIFAYCEDIESVVFMGDISAIPEGMFRGCTALSQIELPDSVTSIGDYAFEGTTIKNITIGRNVASIGSYAFSGNESLSVLTFAANSNLQSIGNSAFAGTSISQVSLPDSLVSLGQRAFEGCELLTSVYVSASLEEMGDYAFANCASLTSVTFGDGAQVVGNYAFANVVNGEVVNSNYLAEVELPSTIQSIGNYAFAGNTVIENIDISGVESVGNYAFYGTTALTTVTVDESLSYVGISAFEDSAVSYIDLSGIEYFDARSFYGTAVSDGDLTDAIEIGNSAFYDCTNLRTLRLPNVVQIYASAFYVPSTDENGNTHTGSIRSVDLGDKLVGLGGGAFFNSRIQTIHLPASLEIIGSPAFAGCTGLMRITVDAENETFFVDSTYGGLYRYLDNGTYELVAVPNGLQMREVGDDTRPYVILDGTSRIGAVNFGFGYPGQFRDFYKTAWAAANADATIDDLTVGYSLTSDGSYGPIYQTGTWVNSHYFIPYSCENPERVLDLVEFIASNEGQDLLHNCVNGEYNFDQGSDYWSEIDGAYGYGDGRCKYVWFSYMFSGTEYYVDFENQDWWTAVTYPTDFSNNWATEEDAALVDKAKETISTYVDDVIVDLPAYYNMITLPAEASEIISQLNSLTDEYLTQFIGGQLDVDSDWATYAAAYEDAGALELEQMINEAVATARSNYGG